MAINPSLLIVPYRYKAAKLYSQLPESGEGDFVVTRGTTATRVNASGLIESVASGVPRLDYRGGGCPSLLVEPAATNQIRNNTMVGAVAGTPGTLPTNWIETLAGLTREVVGTGTELGIDYVDIRLSGTASSTLAAIGHDGNAQIAAATGQAWAYSLWLKFVATPTAPNNVRMNIREATAAGTLVLDSEQTITPNTTLKRYIYARTLSGGGTVERVNARIFIGLTSGQTYDFTIRIGLPQMELGSVATSVIKTSTTAVTRNADFISLSSASGLIGQSAGTIYAEVDIRTIVPTATPRRPISLEAATDTNSLIINIATDGAIQTILGGVTRTTGLNTSSTNGNVKIAVGYSAAGFVTYINGVLRDTYTGAWTQPTWNNVGLGNSVNTAGRQFNDRIYAAAIYTSRLSNSELASLTQL
jgi:hypothetical protein